VKVDQQCNKVIDSPFPVNPAGFTIHSCIHAVRDDAGCVLHTHSRAGVAVSAQKCGVLPISQQSTFVLASLAYHAYEGVAFRPDEKPRLQADLGKANYLVLRNHGLLTVGRSIADAFLSMYTFENTCRIQIDALRFMVLNAAWKMDTVGNKIAKKEIAMIKVLAPNVACQVIDWAMQVHGGGGVCQDFGLASAYAHARTLRFADGPDEVHRNAVAKMELGEQTSIADSMRSRRRA